MLPRILLGLAPVLVVVTVAFSLLHFYVAAIAARSGVWPFVAFRVLLGVAGIALAMGIWRTYLRVRTPRA